VGQFATHLDNAVNADTSLLQDGDDVLAALCRLVRDAARDQLALVVGGDLARDEDLGAGDDGLALVCCVSTVIACWSRPRVAGRESDDAGLEEGGVVRRAQQLS
jgi:hypothetical protein